MLKLSAALTASILALGLPAAYGFSSQRARKTVAASLLRQMNSTRDGHITRRVTCTFVSKRERTFACDLQSVISTHLEARVAVVDGGLREIWAPLQG